MPTIVTVNKHFSLSIQSMLPECHAQDMNHVILSCNLRLNSEFHNRNIRNKDDFPLPKYNINNNEGSQNSVFYRGIELQNEMKNCTIL